MSACQVLIDRPRSGAWNMALDEVLAERAASEQRPQIRVYSWQAPTLSLGYFQRAADRAAHRLSSDCPLVRRPSGGGAIVHDQEVTYAVAVPGDDRVQGMAIYRRVHAAFVTMLASWGVKATTAEAALSEKKAALPLLCFKRHAAGDVLIEWQKVIGSAQRRRQGALLQHGSVLLRASRAAPELPGIMDLAPLAMSDQEWAAHVLHAILVAFDWSPMERSWAPEEMQLARQIVETKYACPAWNERR